MKSQIALRIAGTKERKAGFAALVIVGVLDGGEGENMDRVTLISEKPSFVIKQTPEYVLYQLIDRKVTSYDVDTPGILSIAVTIPAKKRLATKSPYSLLMEVYNTFRSTYMKETLDGKDSFVNVDVKKDLFDDIVKRYNDDLTDGRTAYVSMNPQGLTGIVCVAADKLDDFFRDTQYPEFRKYKDIEIGTSCQNLATPELAGLEIPRPVNYEVWVNGKSVSFSLSREEDSYTASALATSTHEYESVSFTLGELLGSKNGQLQKGDGSVIRLDAEHERIDCQLKKKEIKYLVRLGWINLSETARTEILALLKEKKVGIKLSDMLLDWKDEVYVPVSKVYAPVTLTSNQWGVYNLSASSSVDSSARVLTITIKGTSVQNVTKNANNRNIPLNQTTELAVTSDNHSNSYVNDPLTAGSSVQAKRKRLWLLMGACWFTGVLCGVGGTFLWQNLSGKENVSSSEESSIVEVGAETKEEPVTTLPEEKDRENDSLRQEIVEQVAAEQVAAEQAAAEQAAAEQAAAKQAVAEENARIELQRLVVAGDIVVCRAHPGWKKYLTPKERNTVEGLLNLNGKRGTVRKKLENLRDKYLPAFTWEQVDFLNSEIVKIESENRK